MQRDLKDLSLLPDPVGQTGGVAAHVGFPDRGRLWSVVRPSVALLGRPTAVPVIPRPVEQLLAADAAEVRLEDRHGIGPTPDSEHFRNHLKMLRPVEAFPVRKLVKQDLNDRFLSRNFIRMRFWIPQGQ